MLLNNDIKILDRNNYKLVIDEVEKFSHPEMIFKICDMLIEISKRMDVIVTTHSPLFLERILLLNKKFLNDTNLNIQYKLKHKLNEEPLEINIKSKLTCISYREIEKLCKIIFGSKVFLVEGIHDHNLLLDVMNTRNEFNNVYYSIVDCYGKNNVEKFFKIIKDLGLYNYIDVCLFYDKDRNQNQKEINTSGTNVYSIINDPDVEERFFQINSGLNGSFIVTTNGNISKNQGVVGFGAPDNCNLPSPDCFNNSLANASD